MYTTHLTKILHIKLNQSTLIFVLLFITHVEHSNTAETYKLVAV